ncbi:MAG: glycosyltransferase family 4 protein [Flavobacterium sp.]|uniref:glycosyltransferase family 4 protein n=1 Tax=Flavobacterium sp. TaxID=239 RepID=UPI0022BB70FC|nr:glycosyltransferase family 4 protein [Flavobacterium sp.]MCZ8298041.1 glycosyltransferase family 4 protein [Flavobacterium sp.]
MVVTPMHIAVVCNYRLMPERVGGMDHFFVQFNQQCLAAGIAVDWYFPNTATHLDYASFSLMAAEPEALETVFLAQLPQKNYRVIFTHFLELCTPFFAQVRQLSQARIVAVDHNPRPARGYSWKKRLEKRIKGWRYQASIDLFIAVSKAMKRDLISDFGSIPPSKIRVIPNGIDDTRLIQKTDFTPRYHFLTASHLRPEKGLHDLVAAVAQLDRTALPHFQISIFGEGPAAAALQQQVATHQLESIIHFEGSVPTLHQRYHEFDALLHPSHGETFCYAVVEALMANLPVITTRHQGNVLGLVQHGVNGLLFEEGGVDELSHHLKTLLLNPTMLQNGGHRCPEVRQYTLGQMVENYLNIVRECSSTP